jgi:hypothetical protein
MIDAAGKNGTRSDSFPAFVFIDGFLSFTFTCDYVYR